MTWKGSWRDAEFGHREEVSGDIAQHRAYLSEWMKLHHVVQIRPEVHLIPGM